jgi:2-polyprenyl-3-methyl-5-hydroxy-6-metoxy-1,4-benzoquinol methylase
MALTQITYDADYFQGDLSETPEPSGYGNYAEPDYRDTSTRTGQLIQKTIDSGISVAGKKVLILGCAYGYLVKHLVSLEVDAYGLDISSFAISQAPAEIASRVFVVDARLEASFEQAKTLAGLTKRNDKFDLIVDEDMIGCLTDAEAVTFCTLGKSYSNMFYHLIDVSPHLAQWYNLYTVAEWKAIVGTSPKEKWFERFSWEER